MVRAARNTVSCATGKPPAKTIGRLSLYRRLLRDLFAPRGGNVYSRELAEAAGGTAAQVRRDLMMLGCSGCPRRGYDVQELARGIDEYLDAGKGQGVALVGVGNLGRALIAFFSGRCSKLELRAAFDNDPAKVDRVVGGCKVYSIDELPGTVRKLGIRIAIIAVPASEAQSVADTCFRAGVRGILNFAPTPVQVPDRTYVSGVDLTMALETVAFFAKGAGGRSPKPDA